MAQRGKILVIGHSHMHALSKAAPADDTFEFVSCWERRDGQFQDKAVGQFLGYTATPYEAVVLMVGGNQHITLGLVNHAIPFDFHLPEQHQPQVDLGATLIPLGLMERCLTRYMAPELTFTTALANMFKPIKLYQIEPPPPLPSGYIEQHPHAFEAVVKRFGVSPLARRCKLWRLQSQIVRRHGAAMNMTFIDVPPGVQDEDGGLAAPYRRNDPTHANSLYGELVIGQIRRRVAIERDLGQTGH